MKNKKINLDLIIGVFLLFISILFFKMADNFPKEASMWPKFSLIIIMILCLSLAIISIINPKKDMIISKINHKKIGSFFLILAFISLYYISMKKFGFFISTSIFMPISMYLSKQKNIILIIGVTLFLEIFIYLLFVMQLGLRMP